METQALFATTLLVGAFGAYFLTVTDRAGFLAGERIWARWFASPPVAVMALILVASELMKRRDARTE